MQVPGSVNQHLGGRRALNLVIAADAQNYNLINAALAAGWDGIEPIDLACTVNAGVYVTSSSTSTPAFTTGSSYPAGTIVTLINNGYILGRGGNAGVGGNGSTYDRLGYAGQNGGPAFEALAAIKVINNGTIGGGGGGGAGGDSAYYVHYTGYPSSVSGGGGGGGAPYGLGAAAGPNCPAPSCPGPGTNATLTSNGVGGPNGGPDDFYGNYSVAGGNGGGWGQSGTTNASGYGPGSAPGAAGNAVNGNANITWQVTGTRLGPIT